MMMRRLLAGAIFALASASHAAACSPGDRPTLDGLAHAHIVAKVSVTRVEDSNIPYAMLTFDTLETYSGEVQPEWKVVWQKGLSSLSVPVPFGLGETYIVGLVRPERYMLARCPASVLPCPQDPDGEFYPQIMTYYCYAPASHAFAFSDLLEKQVLKLFEAAQ